MSQVEQWILDFLNNPTYVIVTDVVLVLLLIMAVYRHQVRFMLKSLTRNGVRTVLTSLATMVLVFVVTLVWSVLSLLDKVTTEKSQNVKGHRHREVADPQPDAAGLRRFSFGRRRIETR